MLGKRVMFTPNGFDVSVRVSRMASRRAAGLGCVSAVNIPTQNEVLEQDKW